MSRPPYQQPSKPSHNPYASLATMYGEKSPLEAYIRDATQQSEQNMSQVIASLNRQYDTSQQQLQQILQISDRKAEEANQNLLQVLEQSEQQAQTAMQRLLEASENSSNPYQSLNQYPAITSNQFPTYSNSGQQSSQVMYPPQSFSHQSSSIPSSSSQSQSVNPYSAAPAPPPGPTLHVPPPTTHALIPSEALAHLPTRPVSARARLGKNAVLDARKGLSRVIDAKSFQDIQLFGEQLRQGDQKAIEIDWTREDSLPVFAVSYVQFNPATGRFKFNSEQWQCFVRIIGELVECGVGHFRVWLDQCLWLRDASQGGWAHTGLLPYVMWPVISLGIKRVSGECSVETEKRMWPFLEELCGLWGMGVMFAREMRSADVKDGWRKWMSYAHRARLEPEKGMELLLLNIFHGAADHLETGWQEDVKELKEMARANVLLRGSELYIGSDWKQRISLTRASFKTFGNAIQDMALPMKTSGNNAVNMFLDGSRTVICGQWNGVREWLSGDNAFCSTNLESVGRGFMGSLTKVQVLCDEGEFILLNVGNFGTALWLLVAMNGFTSNFSRGKVAWTKVMTGVECCQLNVQSQLNNLVVQHVLEKQLRRSVKVRTVTKTFGNIEWE